MVEETLFFNIFYKETPVRKDRAFLRGKYSRLIEKQQECYA